MQMMSLMIFTVIGMALFAALSLTLYQALPRSVLESGARHGRFADFGTNGRADQRPAGNVLVTDYEALQRQSA
jgi:hypothetical protein